MSRKDYKETARILSSANLTDEVRSQLVSAFVTMFADDNPRFSPSWFRDACQPEGRLSSDYEALKDDGYSVGVAAGSWVIDGNTSTEAATLILRMIDEGDPEWFDTVPNPLSGEWADDPAPSTIFERCNVANVTEDEESELLDYWSAGFQLGYETEVVRSARSMLGLFPSDLQRS